MNLDQLLNELGQRIGLPGARLQDGVCRLVFDGITNVDFEEAAGGEAFHMYTAIGAIPHDATARKALYVSLLGENSSGENAMAVVPEENTVYLCRTEHLSGLEVDALVEVVADFVRQARSCGARLEQPEGYSAPSARGDALTNEVVNFIRV